MRSPTSCSQAAAALFAAVFFVSPVLAQESLAPAAARAARGVVHVSVLFETRKDRAVRVERSSSGFIVDPRGLVVTNEHLVDEIATGEGAPGKEFWLEVVLDGDKVRGATVIARDERLDLALLQLALEEGDSLDALALDAGLPPAAGSDAFTLGKPRARQLIALAGTVSHPCGPVALRAGMLEPRELLITDAAILDEVDGGPFVDRGGRVLGIMNTVQHLAFDPKAEDKTPRNMVDYAVAVRSETILRAFGERLVAAKGPAKSTAQEVAARIVRDCSPSIVSVWTGAEASRPKHSAPDDPYAEKPEDGLASGVIVDPAGLVLTTYSVIGDEEEVGVLLQDGRSFRAKVLRALPGSQAALLKLVLPEGTKVPAVPLGSSEAALAGETVAVLGNPYGNTPAVSVGVVSALEVDERLRLGAWVHDAHLGGAVLDASGRLIGLPAADIFEGRERATGESYLGVALPIDRLRRTLAKEFEEHGTAAGVREVPKTSEKELALRRDKVTGIVDGTRDSLVNVEIMARSASSGGFDPFATPGDLRPLGQGSGVIIDASGLAITNWHVVEATLAEDGTQRSDHEVEVTLPSKKRYTARVLATSRDDDLALIRLELPEGDVVKPVPLGASKELRHGDIVVAIGNPYGKANTVTVGIVAQKEHDARISGRLTEYKGMLQTDAAINPGNSGGALLDLEGRLVGINSAGRSGAGLAIPVERVREVFGQKLMATMGPYLGVIVEDARESGVSIRSVDEHSPAAKAGVAVGDRLIAIEGKALKSAMEFGNMLLALRSAPRMLFELERSGSRVTAEVRPISHAVWRLFRQTGIEVAEVDYAAEAASVLEASIALHRAYTGLDGSEPSRAMSGALRVVQAVPRADHPLAVKVGDMLLGGTAVTRTVDGETARLVRFEDVVTLRDFFEPLATKEGDEAECWILREGKVAAVNVTAIKVR